MMDVIDKREMAEFCARISSRLSKIDRTEEEWVEFYFGLSDSELTAEYMSYMC